MNTWYFEQLNVFLVECKRKWDSLGKRTPLFYSCGNGLNYNFASGDVGCGASSETQGQIVGRGKVGKGEKKSGRRKVKGKDFSSPTFFYARSDFPSPHYLPLGLRGWIWGALSKVMPCSVPVAALSVSPETVRVLIQPRRLCFPE